VNFISETKNKKRRTEGTGAAREEFTAVNLFNFFYALHNFTFLGRRLCNSS
jgi:hypothetical protein